MSDTLSQASVPSETTLFNAQGLLVTSQRVVAQGRTWPLGDVEAVDSIRRGPWVVPWLVTLMLGGGVGLPVLLSAMAAQDTRERGIYGVALVVSATAIYSSIAALVLMGDTYWLVLRTRKREGRVLRSRDPQLISSLVAVVAQAAAAARQRN
ncbi:DUF6232 family protein [Hyalangium versicolor]|uniref:DUF6232 family protein n=1 Tax=Hyalangium versicolor TaxID=2861190 RepID=UPI001CCE1C77|nr:DUF6232 family protein [Hyalangium versicolor]